jgi:amidase
MSHAADSTPGDHTGASGTADLAELDLLGQAELLRAGEVSPTELVDAALARAERLNPTINAIIHPRPEAARAEAAAATTAPSGPFAGIPMVVKDLGCAQAGEPHHMGVRALRDIGYRAPHDSALWRRLRAAGFISIGRTNTPEWGCTITTEPLAYGPSRNPWNPAHSTGGSSGGSAAAVAAGIVAIGHASDGGGSIRIPASECGLVGLKPSRGRISNAPDVGEAWMGSTTNGAVTRSVRDAAAMLDVMAGAEPGDPYTATPFARPLLDEVGTDPGRLRVGLLDHPVLGAAGHAECTEAVVAAGRLLEGLGHHVDVSWPAAIGDPSFAAHFRAIVATWTANDIAELEAILGRPVGDGDIEPDNAALGAIGRSVTAPHYVAAMLEVHRWCRSVLSWWHPADGARGFDVLVTPTIAAPPPKIGYLSEPGQGRRVFELLQYTAQFNVTGQPAISLPLHQTPDGLPVGVQFVAAAGREDLLVRLAAQIEQAAPWRDRRPPLFG